MKKNLFKDQLDVFFTAMMFFTRIPVPKNIDHSQGMLQRSARYFSWVGLLVGGIVAIVFVLCSKILSPSLAILFSMLAGILTTGAFHEDGFADCCDAFGGGWTKEKILLIMKDSRLGTFGVIGLVGVLCFKFLLLGELLNKTSVTELSILLVAAHSSSRLMAVFIMQQYDYVQDIDLSKSKPLANRKLSNVEILIAVIAVILPFLFLPPFFALAILPMLLVCRMAGGYFKKWIGGYTGDCLGATQQLTELFFYLGILLITQYL